MHTFNPEEARGVVVGPVSTWTDQAGSHDFLQSNPAFRPTGRGYPAARQAGFPDGRDDFIIAADRDPAKETK
jgi:hypothetical protein